MKSVDFHEVGADRLLQLADILDKAKPHRRPLFFGNEGGYHQRLWVWDCNTPGCALGHWAIANRDRWDIGNHSIGLNGNGPSLSAMHEFGITRSEVSELFGGSGCGGAETNPKKAAAYIRSFVKRKLMCPT